MFEATLRRRGDMIAVLNDLGLDQEVLARRLAVLRANGVARTVTLHDPRRQGRPCRILNLVRLDARTWTRMTGFEAMLVADPAVVTADRILGDYDYRITTFHADHRDAQVWMRGLMDQGAARIHQTPVRGVLGHELATTPLHHVGQGTTWGGVSGG